MKNHHLKSIATRPIGMTRKRSLRVIGVISVIVVLSAAGFVVHDCFELKTENASLRWPTVRGTIAQSDRVFSPSGSSPPNGGSSSLYRADVAYSYLVNGLRYVSHQICLWSPDLRISDKLNAVFVSRYPVGTLVHVYYDPKNPGNAVLIPGADEEKDEGAIEGGGVVLVTGIFGIIFYFRENRRVADLLNGPDTAAHPMHLRANDIQKGIYAFAWNLCLTLLFAALAMTILLWTSLAHPLAELQVPRPSHPGRLIAEIACLTAFLFFFMRALKNTRRVECPFCATFLNQKARSTRVCPGCGTRIIFDDNSPQPVSDEAKFG